MILANGKFATFPSRFYSFKIIFPQVIKFCYFRICVNNGKCLTPQNMFEEDLRP